MRECGDCTECCIHLPNPATTDKHGNCRYLGKGCTIQATKPTPCAAFRCGWLQGMGTEEDRPDKSGKIIMLKGPGVPRNVTFNIEEQNA